jgi:hypothetical protein
MLSTDILRATFLRKGGETKSTKMFENFDLDGQAFFARLVELDRDEVPVIGTLTPEASSLLITSHRLISSDRRNRIVSALELVNYVSPSPGSSADWKRQQQSRMIVHLLNACRHELEIEGGKPLIGIWHVLNAVGAHNRSRRKLTTHDTQKTFRRVPVLAPSVPEILHWRFLGSCPQPRNREEVRTCSIDRWNPWAASWAKSPGPVIVISDPLYPSRLCHVHTYKVDDRSMTKFAAKLLTDDVWRFWVPAEAEDVGAFAVAAPKYEGYWRRSLDEVGDLPWPYPEVSWKGRREFLNILEQAEKMAERIAFRGFSVCRICVTQNGSDAFRLEHWEWPSGFRHYVEYHDVRPSSEFIQFILNSSR